MTGAAACGGSDAKDKKQSATGGSGQKKAMPDYAGAVATPPKQAPTLSIRDSNGKAFDIARERGKVVLVTWVYSHCPDVCPLIVSNLKVAQTKLGARARDVAIVAVSTDPKGDTPKAVNKFVAAHGMTGRMLYLVGNKATLGAAWKRWGIVAQPSASNPELVEHSAPIYGISASGKITTLYPANFKPEQIIHDVPLLAEQ
jgi:protein SCO1/2